MELGSAGRCQAGGQLSESCHGDRPTAAAALVAQGQATIMSAGPRGGQNSHNRILVWNHSPASGQIIKPVVVPV